ncbi:MAG: class I SAM-dependent DNA methyltransferase [Candidatus Rifleibacteriota bacterium]
MSDYRLSHQSSGRGDLYDQRFVQNRTAFYWQEFEKPFLEIFFADLSLPDDAKVLDFACGTGRITNLLNRRFASITAIDVSAAMLEQARRSLSSVNFMQLDLTRENADLPKFDLITAFRFFLNAQPELRHEALRALVSLLKPHGIMIVNNHRRKSSLNGFLTWFCRCLNLCKRNCLSDEEFEALLVKHGLVAQKIFSFSLIPGFHAFPPVSRPLWLRLEKMAERAGWFNQMYEQTIYLCRKKHNNFTAAEPV